MKNTTSKGSSSWILLIIALLIAGYFFHWDVYLRKVSDQEVAVLETMYDTFNDATEAYTEGGYVKEGYEEECLDAVADEAEQWKEDGIAKSVSKYDNYVEIEFKSGIRYLYFPKQADEDSLDVSDDVEVLTYQPCLSTYSAALAEEMTYPASAAEGLAALSDSWSYSTKLVDGEVIPSSIEKNMGENQIILWHGHGAYTKDNGPVLQLGEVFDADRYKTDKSYQKRYNYRELYLMGDNNVVATPKFFKKYLGSLKNSVVYLGTCCSGYTDDLADVFLKKGAVAVIGNSDTIRTAYNTRMMKSVAYYLGQRDSDGEYMDLASALAKAKEDWGADDSVSFGGDGATAVIFGGSDALGFRITGAAAVSSVAVAPVEEEPSVDTQALYEAFLAANTSYKYYACVDMNGDGVDELLAAQNKSDLTVTTYPSDYIMCQFADVYTIQNGTVTYAGNLGSSLDNLYYNSTNHCVESYWGGSGYSQFIFCTVDNSGNLITKYLSYSLDDDTYYYGDDVADDDIIDKSTYDEYYSMWNTDVEYIEFQQNS